ncbi:hypothetical protein LMG23992_04297 [Cupriavidus laharis]|uniref:Uncharacterized protein n=1 Tax=Cupriavidus laharis TaxID=151654 RepID=A0ABM8XKB4_9BURK|nr:hypothetical protein LMG23992_04297 [Cupriavidus laharis]
MVCSKASWQAPRSQTILGPKKQNFRKSCLNVQGLLAGSESEEPVVPQVLLSKLANLVVIEKLVRRHAVVIKTIAVHIDDVLEHSFRDALIVGDEPGLTCVEMIGVLDIERHHEP